MRRRPCSSRHSGSLELVDERLPGGLVATAEVARDDDAVLV
jgi:hypothetical protein